MFASLTDAHAQRMEALGLTERDCLGAEADAAGLDRAEFHVGDLRGRNQHDVALAVAEREEPFVLQRVVQGLLEVEGGSVSTTAREGPSECRP